MNKSLEMRKKAVNTLGLLRKTYKTHRTCFKNSFTLRIV